MKKLKKIRIALIVVILILLASLLTVVLCLREEDEDTHLQDYYQLGLFYSIPEDLVLRNLAYGDLVYTNGEAYFFINAFDSDTLAEDTIFHDPDLTPVEYTDSIINDLSADDNVSFDIAYKYDEKNNTTLFAYVYNYDEDEYESEYFINKVLRTEDYLYIATLSCYEADLHKYEDLFHKIMDSVKV